MITTPFPTPRHLARRVAAGAAALAVVLSGALTLAAAGSAGAAVPSPPNQSPLPVIVGPTGPVTVTMPAGWATLSLSDNGAGATGAVWTWQIPMSLGVTVDSLAVSVPPGTDLTGAQLVSAGKLGTGFLSASGTTLTFTPTTPFTAPPEKAWVPTKHGNKLTEVTPPAVELEVGGLANTTIAGRFTSTVTIADTPSSTTIRSTVTSALATPAGDPAAGTIAYVGQTAFASFDNVMLKAKVTRDDQPVTHGTVTFMLDIPLVDTPTKGGQIVATPSPRPHRPSTCTARLSHLGVATCLCPTLRGVPKGAVSAETTVTATYRGDSTSAHLDFETGPSGTPLPSPTVTLSVAPADPVAGQPVTLTATLDANGAPAYELGQLLVEWPGWTSGGLSCMAPVMASAATVSCTVPSLRAGTWRAYAELVGTQVTAGVLFHVAKATPKG